MDIITLGLIAGAGYLLLGNKKEVEKTPSSGPVYGGIEPSGSGYPLDEIEVVPANDPLAAIGITPIVIPETAVSRPADVVPVIQEPLNEPVVVQNLIVENPSILGNVVSPLSTNTVATVLGVNAAQTIGPYMKDQVETGNAGYDPGALNGYVTMGVYDRSVLDHYAHWGEYWLRRQFDPNDRNYSPGLVEYHKGRLDLAIAWLRSSLYNGYRNTGSFDYYYRTHA
jgi:hypothetical protein